MRGAETAGRVLTDAETDEHGRLIERATQLGPQIHEAELTHLRALVTAGGVGMERGDGAGIGDPDAGRRGDGDRDGVLGRAHRAIEAAARSGLLPDSAAEHATGLIETGSVRDRTLAARWAAAAGSEAYTRAFAAVVMDPQRGHMTWTAEEQDAYRAVEQVAGEMRAMSLSDASGGFMVPLTLDPAIMLTGGGVVSPLRRRARVATIVTDSWNGITSAGVTSEWLAEAAEAAAVTPTLAQPSVPVHKLSTYVEYSVEVGMDAVNFVRELQTLMLDSAVQTAETAYTVGTGSGQPTGLITRLMATAGSIITPTTAETFAAADPVKVQNALPVRFQRNASWLAALATINTMAGWEGSSGLRFPEIANGQLLRRPLDELSVMDSSFDAAVTAANPLLVYGDLKAGFLIVDRIGATFEIVQHVLGSNRRPTGQRGAWLWQRTGSDAVVPNAFRVLNVATTA